ncbi:MAG: leucine-rich repeat domain-containing protein [Eubacterium sp.]|nr:leucine-rich repeat domain-containing protein [Eubacterium sp.]
MRKKLAGISASVLLVCICFMGMYLTCTFSNAEEIKGKLDNIKIVKLGDGITAQASFDDTGVSLKKINLSKKCKRIVIPEKIEGKPVVRLASSATDSESNLDDEMTNLFGKVFEPAEDGDLTVEERFPANNVFVKEIVLPDTVSYIGKRCFAGLINLKKVNIPLNTKSIEEETFARCEKLKQITLPKKIEKIDKTAFVYCKSLEKIHVKKGNKNFIEKGDFILRGDKKTAFMLSRRKKCVVVPEGVKYFDRGTFDELTAQKIVVSKKNKILSSDNNCVYKKKGKVLVAAISSNKKKFVISSKVKVLSDTIAWGGFARKVILPSTIKKICGNWKWGLYSDNNNQLIVFKRNNPPKVSGANPKNALLSQVYLRFNKGAEGKYKKLYKKYHIKLIWSKSKKAYYCI